MSINVGYKPSMSSLTHDLLVLTAPPATGKTYWIRSFSEALPDEKIMVISPLRALADECREKWKDEIIVMTPEEWLGKKVYARITIFDEFHLWFYWGDSFRPLMWEVFYELSLSSSLSVLLTATLSQEMEQEISLFQTHFHSLYWMNCGNQILRNLPSNYIKAPSKRWILNQALAEQSNSCVKLIFCEYRKEVFEMERILRKEGFSCITCVGGESKYMRDKLRENSSPDFIISTTVLSHGVNLPEIKKIYFLYEIKNIDFWIQMVARGGRRGEQYEVFSLEVPVGLEWNSWSNYIQVLWLSLKQKMKKGLNDLMKY